MSTLPAKQTLFTTALLLLIATCSAACSPPPEVLSDQSGSAAAPELTAAPSPTVQHSATPAPSPTAQPSRTASPTATPTPALSICSPLEGIALEEMGEPDLLKVPFEEPRPGMDDGHHGADFAYYSRGERKEMIGLPVYSVLNGIVAGVIHDRPPYGNAVIIETRIEAFSPEQFNRLQAPTPAPTVQPPANLTCPEPEKTASMPAGRSLYLLYAHLNQPPLVSTGQAVTCGQQIGEVGTTGNSVNPHLHLETRIGPSGAVFPSMAHYDASITEEEMRNYCIWRVSGLFQMFDPMLLLSLQP